MKYQGGKARPGKAIAELLRGGLKAGTGYYVEPFLGAAGVARHVAPHAVQMALSDVQEDLIYMWQALAGGWDPPSEMTEERYYMLRGMRPCPERAFAGFGCSFSGKWWGGYARDRVGTRNFAAEARRGLLKITADIQRCPRVSFRNQPYSDASVLLGDVVYCDPPYAGTLGYKGAPAFDHERFWDWATRLVDETHAFVFVSEFNAPPGWVPVWGKARDASMHGDPTKNAATDQLFCKPVVAEILGLKVCETTHDST
jgi:DNA adenine methylase